MCSSNFFSSPTVFGREPKEGGLRRAANAAAGSLAASQVSNNHKNMCNEHLASTVFCLLVTMSFVCFTHLNCRVLYLMNFCKQIVRSNSQKPF